MNDIQTIVSFNEDNDFWTPTSKIFDTWSIPDPQEVFHAPRTTLQG